VGENAHVESSGVRYAKSGDVEVAYEILGSGPVDMVYIPGFISHLDLQKELEPFGEILRRLTRFARLLVLDKRGTGLSSRDFGSGSLSERMDDIRAVMDHAGWERANVFGVSEGGPLSVLFAATSPQRVAKLVLSGTYARLQVDDADTPDFDVPRYLNWLERSWGTGNVIKPFLGPDNPAPAATLARYERASTTPGIARQIMSSNIEIDVRPHLAAVSAPTLVLHNTGDAIVPIERARELAAALPDASLVELPGRAHLPMTAADFDRTFEAIERFVTGQIRMRVATERVLATVMFTDMVDSTAQAADLGDRRWRAVLDRHDDRCRRLVDRFGGRVVKLTGDGLLATFEAPARAVLCALVLRDDLGADITIRAGLHTGEVERRGDDIGGIGVHIAARVASLAGAGEVLTSRTVRDLVVGSDLSFVDRGAHELKGVPEAWQLYAASA
jgi:class 3 adenylate cyclase